MQNSQRGFKEITDRPQFSNKTNKCLNCAGDHGTTDCPQDTNHTHLPLATQLMAQVFTKIAHNLKNHSPQQHSQQSASTMNISTPMLMVNNPLQSDPQQGQQQHQPPQIPPQNQPTNSPVRHNQFNQQFQQPPMPQVSSLMAPPQQHYNSQIPPPYFHHYPL